MKKTKKEKNLRIKVDNNKIATDEDV